MLCGRNCERIETVTPNWDRPEGGRALRPKGFTLLELLVVVAIVSLLISILLPSLISVREQARASQCLSNLRQVGVGLQMYVMTSKDHYPQHSSLKALTTDIGKPRTRWPDYLHNHMRSEEVYECPSLSPIQRQDFALAWAHPTTRKYGGYGYNFQYLGNSRIGTARASWSRPFFASASTIRKPAQTLAIADTRGTRKGIDTNRYGQGGAGVYAVDPPLGSRDLGSMGSRNKPDDPDVLWYEGGKDPVADEDLWRSRPDDRHRRRSNIVFADSHAEPMQVDVLDARAADGAADNRYYNGFFDSTRW